MCYHFIPFRYLIVIMYCYSVFFVFVVVIVVGVVALILPFNDFVSALYLCLANEQVNKEILCHKWTFVDISLNAK